LYQPWVGPRRLYNWYHWRTATLMLTFFLLIILMHSSDVTAQVPCECNDCTQLVLTTDARGKSCGQRIAEYRQSHSGTSAIEACTAVAEAYPWQCGPACHPTKCDGQAPPVCNW
jgi:hypothetical protein